MNMIWSEQVVLVTGGTGSFGKKFIEIMLNEYCPQKLVVFSRDELKQHEMRAAGLDHSSLGYFFGEVRDRHRLKGSLAVDTGVVQAAVLRLVPACDYIPFDGVQTSIMGARN